LEKKTETEPHELWFHAASERVMFKGEVAEPGFGHFRKYRPKFYQTVLALSGVALYPGTINVRIDGEMPHFPLPNTQRIPGQDQIDLDHNQDILITPCLMEGRPGFWIPAGHFSKQIIEISLVEEIPNITPGLTVSLEIPGTPLH
jgi:CTP-dependent riboflavin kinase